MSHYAAISRQIREIFERFTPVIEPLSLNEAFLDVSGSLLPRRELLAIASLASIRHSFRGLSLRMTQARGCPPAAAVRLTRCLGRAANFSKKSSRRLHPAHKAIDAPAHQG
jgi:nucleotidyltransferase/DNA polymerase involved in DNA repair